MCYRTRWERVPTPAVRVVTEHFSWQSGKSPSPAHEGIEWFKCTGCHKLQLAVFLHGLRLRWYCQLTWPCVHLHGAKRAIETRQVTSEVRLSLWMLNLTRRQGTGCFLRDSLLDSLVTYQEVNTSFYSNRWIWADIWAVMKVKKFRMDSRVT